MSKAPVLPRTKSQESPSQNPGLLRAKSQDIENVQRSLIESAQKPVAMHVRSPEPEANPSRRESPAVKMLSPRLDSSRVDARSPPRFERPHSPVTQSKPNILRLGSHRRVFSDDITPSSKPDLGRRASLGENFKSSPTPPNPGMGRRSSLNDSLLRRQYSSPRPDITRPVSMGNELHNNRRNVYGSPTSEVGKPAMMKSQSADCVPNKREYQVRIVKGPQAYDPSSPTRAPEDDEDGDNDRDSFTKLERSNSPDDSKKASRVVVSIPETLITKIQQALKEAGDEGLSCAQLMNTPSCKRLRFPCTLQGATPGSILRELPCVRHDNKRYYFVEPGTASAAPSTEFVHRRLPSRAESIGGDLASFASVKHQYSTAELLEMRHTNRDETDFDISLREKLFLLGLLPGGETDDDSSVRSRASALGASPVLPAVPMLTRKESHQQQQQQQQNGDGLASPSPTPGSIDAADTSSEVQEFTRMLQFYKTHNFCIDSAARVNESATALLTLLSKCGDIPQALYGPGVFPLVRRIYEKTKETPFWSDCRASVHQVITTALQLPQNSSSQQSWLMRFLLGCEASTEERASSQASSSIWNTLTQEIMAEIAVLNPGESLRIRQQGAIERMGVLGKTIKLGLQVFGPVAFGLASILSDVHLQTVGGPKTDAVKLLFSLLQESSQYKNVQMARPGMIQCFDIESALSVTVCCHSRQEYKVASEMTALVLAYRSLDSRFELLFHMVCKWAQMWNLVDEVEGLSLWGWILLVVHYLQSIPSRILPVLDCFVPSTPSPFRTRRDSSPSIAASSILALAAQTAPNSETTNTSWSSSNNDCIGELLVGFFTRYGVEFNPESQCVSVRVGTFLDAGEYRATLRALDPSFAPTPHPHISVASPAHVALAYSSQVSKAAEASSSSSSSSTPSVTEHSKPDAEESKLSQDEKSLLSSHVSFAAAHLRSSSISNMGEDTDDDSSTHAKLSNGGATSPVGKQANGTEAVGANDEADSRVFPSSIEIPDIKSASMASSPASSPPLSSNNADVSVKSMHHRRTSSLTTIAEGAVSKSTGLTPVGATRSLSISSGTTRPKNCEHALCVEDPFRPTENVAMNTSRAALRRIQEALEIARTSLLAHAPLRQIFVVAGSEEKLPQISEV